MHHLSPQFPPEPPPKPSTHSYSGQSTPAAADTGSAVISTLSHRWKVPIASELLPWVSSEVGPNGTGTEEPGDQWLPEYLQERLQHMSTQDIRDLLGDPGTLSALNNASNTVHPSLRTLSDTLSMALLDNIEAALQLSALEDQVKRQRAAVRAQILATHALERQWRQKQADMDMALGPFSPASLYQKLTHGVQDQTQVWQTLEDSFLDSSGGVSDEQATERETLEWLRKYKEAKVLAYMRRERKDRWDEGRVGGWR